MDVSKEYMEMCSKAEEIQALSGEHNQKSFYQRYKADELYSNLKSVWLPRQDQLQDIGINIIKVLPIHPVSLLALFSHWVFKSGLKVNPNITLEELWLMYIMENNFNKKWDEKSKSWKKIELLEW